MSLKIAVFSAFFERKCSLTAKPSIFDPIVLYVHIRKAEHLTIQKIRLKFYFRHPVERQIFGDGDGLDPALILALCLIKVWAVFSRLSGCFCGSQNLQKLFKLF